MHEKTTWPQGVEMCNMSVTRIYNTKNAKIEYTNRNRVRSINSFSKRVFIWRIVFRWREKQKWKLIKKNTFNIFLGDLTELVDCSEELKKKKTKRLRIWIFNYWNYPLWIKMDWIMFFRFILWWKSDVLYELLLK